MLWEEAVYKQVYIYERNSSSDQLHLQAAPTATCALRHRGSNTTRRRASIDVPEVPLMMVIDCLHAQQAGGARIGSECCAHAALRVLAKLQLRTLGELTMRTLHLERELCARLLCSREAAASLRRPSVGLGASARGAKSRRRHFHFAAFLRPPTQCAHTCIPLQRVNCAMQAAGCGDPHMGADAHHGGCDTTECLYVVGSFITRQSSRSS